MLQTKTEKSKQKIKSILDVCTHVEVLDNGVNVSGHITYNQMKQIVEYLELKIRQGYWYKCVKNVMDNKNEVRLFTEDEHYLCPRDNILLADDDSVVYWQWWHHPENCFVEQTPFDGICK